MGLFQKKRDPISEKAKALHFKRGTDLRPEHAIRSGENGFFSVANADALYRVMKVASVSELGHVLATVGLLGDDPNRIDGCCFHSVKNPRSLVSTATSGSSISSGASAPTVGGVFVCCACAGRASKKVCACWAACATRSKARTATFCHSVPRPAIRRPGGVR